MKQLTYSLFLFFVSTSFLLAQNCQLDLTITLKNIDGGFYSNQTIKLTSRSNGKSFEQVSNTSGKAFLGLPCNDIYDVTISNYSRKKEIKVADRSGQMSRVFSYPANMVQLQKEFTMSNTEKALVDNYVRTLPDSLFLKTSNMTPPKNKNVYASVTIKVKNLKNGPLEDETTTITGVNNQKSIITKTDKEGKINIYVPKGDTYTINFTYNKKYATFQSDYSKGTSKINVEYSYLGTKEIERRKKEEAIRIAAEEKRLKEEELRFKTNCERLGLTEEECRKRELDDYIEDIETNPEEQAISKILDRNQWKNKLIVCDLTGSMNPYTAELSVWYSLNLIKEKNLQFVFFNDGDDAEDSSKTIGNTNGIYYTSAKDVKSLNNLIAKVAAAGSGGDCEENDTEALIKATQLASPFNELILIADGNSPVRDIKLLNQLKHPVHIILCGYDSYVLEDYLKIAWKTKGSIHTIEEDITNISHLIENQNITIKGVTYKIMGGDFIRLE